MDSPAPAIVDLEALVEERFGLDKGWFTLREVSNTAGWAANRRIDLLSIGVWGSNSLHTKAFEVKRTRADFAKELEQPAKREAFAKQVNEFWFVAPKGVIDPSEVPEGCGLLLHEKRGLVRRKNATQTKNDPSKGLFTAVIKAAIRRIEQADAGMRNFAAFRGRELTFAQFQKIWQESHSYLERRMLEQRDRDAKERARRHEQSGWWIDVLRRLDQVGRRLIGASSYRDLAPEQRVTMKDAVIKAIDSIDQSAPMPAVAKKLRLIADQLDGGAA